jgi:hypothetical protein
MLAAILKKTWLCALLKLYLVKLQLSAHEKKVCFLLPLFEVARQVRLGWLLAFSFNYNLKVL